MGKSLASPFLCKQLYVFVLNLTFIDRSYIAQNDLESVVTVLDRYIEAGTKPSLFLYIVSDLLDSLPSGYENVDHSKILGIFLGGQHFCDMILVVN